VAVITDSFAASVRAVAAAQGLPDYPFVVIPHPIADNADATLRAKAELAVQAMVPLLTGRAGAGRA
jgi:hypothetical protein